MKFYYKIYSNYVRQFTLKCIHLNIQIHMRYILTSRRVKKKGM